MKGEELRKFRKSKNLNQSEFAKFFGVTQEAVSQYESDKRKIPDEVLRVVNSFPALDKEKAAISFANDHVDDFVGVNEFEVLKDSFLAGVEWMEKFKTT